MENMTLAGPGGLIVLIFGIAVCLLSVWSMFVPADLRKFVQFISFQAWGYYLAIIVRILLGLALIFAAPDSRFPGLFQFIGWLAIIAAVGLAGLGQDRMRGIVAWFDKLSDTVFRGWLVIAIIFGASLAYGAW